MADKPYKPNAWLDALQDLEKSKPVPKKETSPPPVNHEGDTARLDEPPPRPAKNDTPTPEGYILDALEKVDIARRRLKAFKSDHPYLIAPNVFQMWEDNLKETEVLMGRELDRIGPKKQ